MNKLPELYSRILKDTHELGFDQLSDENIGSLLSTLWNRNWLIDIMDVTWNV